MNIGVIGLGYVGITTAVCLAKLGHKVIGVDTDITRINTLHRKISPVDAAGVQDLLNIEDVNLNLFFTVRLDVLIKKSDVIMICVGTPDYGNGDVDLSQVKKVIRDIEINEEKTIILRSTVPPGTCESLLDYSKFYHNPEFLREAHAVDDFMNPAVIVLGTKSTPIRPLNLIGILYSGIYSKPKIAVVPYRISELLKYANNAFHAMKIVFANELADIAEAHGVDGNKLMELICEDKKLNISSKYLIPGLPYGGHCLPKDVKALIKMGLTKDLNISMLEAMDDSNIKHINYLAQSDVASAK